MANLMEASGANSTPESLIVNVKDHDTPELPADLSGSSSSFWKQKDVRIWLYVLGAAILILIVVFVLLSRQTSLFQGYTEVSVSNDTETVDEGDLEDFNGSAANDSVVGEGDFATTPGEGGSIDINDVLDGVVSSGDLEADEIDIDGILDELDTVDDEVVDEVVDNNSEPVVTNPFAPSEFFTSAPTAPGYTEIVVEQGEDFVGFDLNSNTDSGIMDSPDVQGDTGPSVALALIPSIFYALARKRKNEA